MILADKIIVLRRKCGWSQEELADRMNVSRQAVSKWESAQAVPELDKIVQLSRLFGVTTDFLLKDEVEDEDLFDTEARSNLKRVSKKDAEEYFEYRKKSSRYIAIATFLCIISPITLILLSFLSGVEGFPIPENICNIIGIVALILLVAVAVAFFVLSALKGDRFSYLDGSFECEYGVEDFAREKKNAFRNSSIKGNVIGVLLCILSPIPLIVTSILGNDLLSVVFLSLMLVTVGIATVLFIICGVQNSSFEKMLSESNEYDKRRKKLKDAIGNLFWVVVVGVYLAISFITEAWDFTWIIWPAAGILSGIASSIFDSVYDNINDK